MNKNMEKTQQSNMVLCKNNVGYFFVCLTTCGKNGLIRSDLTLITFLDTVTKYDQDSLIRGEFILAPNSRCKARYRRWLTGHTELSFRRRRTMGTGVQFGFSFSLCPQPHFMMSCTYIQGGFPYINQCNLEKSLTGIPRGLSIM